MQKNDILAFLGAVNAHLGKSWKQALAGDRIDFRIFGKSALLLAGLQDRHGTVDIDLLRVEGSVNASKVMADLEKEFGKARRATHGYYLEFVGAGIPLLPHEQEWTILPGYEHLAASFLEPHYQVATKLFSAHSSPSRKRDKQDAIAALDQKIVAWSKVCAIADQILGEFRLDSRSDFFPEVIVCLDELMEDYGTVPLRNRD